MEFFLFIGGIWFLYWVVDVIFDSSNTRRNPNSARRSPNESSTHREKSSPKNKETFRPVSRSSGVSPKIIFNTPSPTSNTSTNTVPDANDLEGLHDAFTGAPLDKNLGLHQCQTCKVYYHTESLQVLREANNSQCVACPSTNIIVVLVSDKATGGKDYTPNVVTLQNYQQHEGAVVTFEGLVHKVNESRRGNDFAVMFENKSWVHGFKLVFFRGSINKVGGADYIKSLTGEKIKVRGLLIKHPKFGYEIIVSENSMILGSG